MTEKPILAIDYGEKRLGLAISDSKGIISTPLTVLEITKRRNVEKVLEDIKSICEEYRVKTILIGKPQAFTTAQEKSVEKIERFSKKLSTVIDLPVIYQDESYSTTEAQNMLLSLGQNTRSSKNKIDMIAASVFLQEFLNSERKNNA